MSFVIRSMTAKDLEMVVLLAPQWSRATYAAILAPTGSIQRFGFVARDEPALTGFAVASWLPGEAEAELETVVVDARYRRQGQGRALLHACMLAAAKAGATAMRLEVRASNAPALALYQQNGFAAVGVRRSYYSAPTEDAVLLQRTLQAGT